MRLLIDSGLWPALRRRPFGGTPRLDGVPDALFVTATDTNPLAPRPDLVIAWTSGNPAAEVMV